MIYCDFPESIYNSVKPNGPVSEKHQTSSGSKLHRKVSFCHVQILGTGASASIPHGFGRDGQKGNLRRTSAGVFFTSRPPNAMKTQTVVPLDSPAGIQTMTVITKASRRAAIAPTTGNAPIQLHADARNALSTAVFYLSQPQANVAGARRKAVQALAALRSLDSAEG